MKVIKRVKVCISGDSGVLTLAREKENAGFSSTVPKSDRCCCVLFRLKKKKKVKTQNIL